MAPLASLWRRLPALIVACIVLVALQGGIAFAKDATPCTGEAAGAADPRSRARAGVAAVGPGGPQPACCSSSTGPRRNPPASRRRRPPRACSAQWTGAPARLATASSRSSRPSRRCPRAIRAVVGNLSEPDGIGAGDGARHARPCPRRRGTRGAGRAPGLASVARGPAHPHERGTAVGRGQAADAGGPRGRLRAGLRGRHPRHLPDALAGPRRAPHPAARACSAPS